MRFILGSASPRRQELLKRLLSGPFEIVPADIDEKSVSCSAARELPLAIAEAKLAKLCGAFPDATILTCDTMVILGDERIGKPRDLNEARAILTELAGREHLVVTGCALRHQGMIHRLTVRSTVFIPNFTTERLESYLATRSCLDKAGAYGIQDPLVEARLIAGSYYNVMGFPLEELRDLFSLQDIH